MDAKALFSSGVKLIGVYFLASGVCVVPSLLGYLQIRDWGDLFDLGRALLTVAVYLGVGWYLLGPAPLINRRAATGTVA